VRLRCVPSGVSAAGMARGGGAGGEAPRGAGGVMSVAIREAQDAAAREEVFRFRYDIYVREMSRPQKDADHARGRIEDRLDAFAMLLAAHDAGTGLICGTVRTNVLCDGDIGEYGGLYRLDGLSANERRSTSITTRLMVERSKRGSVLAA